jgi:hypothetical protein
MSQPQLGGLCVVCRTVLTESDYKTASVVAAIGPEGTVVCCAQHLLGGPGDAEYEQALRSMCAAKIAQLQRSPY